MMLSIGAPQSIGEQKKPVDFEQNYLISYTMTFSTNDLKFDTFYGYDTIELNDGGYTTDLGKPMIPVKNIRIALPEDMKATSIQILDIKEQVLDGKYTLLPAQPSQRIESSFNEYQFIEPDSQTYQSSQNYPSGYIELNGQTDLAGQAMVDVRIYPIHYLPSEKTVTLLTSITFTIHGVSGYIFGDYLPVQISDNDREMYLQMVEDMVVNPADVMLRSSPNPQALGVDPGDYDYVIITQDSWVSAFQPLQEWKTKKGIPTNIVTTSWIYNSGGYSGTNVEKIKAFVQDVHTNWGTLYVLLGGDTNVVPCHYRTFSSVDPDPVANDAYYADFDGDWVCEVNVGRASVTEPGTNTGQIGNFINKILTYEKNPPLTDYAQKAGFFGFDLDSSTHAEQCKINIDNSYIPTSWTTTTVYDSQGGNHKTNVINAINAGQNLLNHADHSGSNYMGTGYVNHDTGLENSDMDDLNNGNKQGIFYSMGCDPAAYDSSNCIAEHFVRDNNGGGVAFIGNSRYGWYNPGNYNTLSMRYDRYFFRSLFDQNIYKLGACFSDHKNDGYQNEDIYKYCYTELTLLGDPEMPIWQENPISLIGSFPSQISTGPTSFIVSVTSGSNPVNQAYVCLWKGTEIYETGSTNSTGEVTFSISPPSSGTMYVTITKQNYLPFEGLTLIMSGNNSPPQTPVQPTGQTTGKINVEYTYTTSTTDPENDQVYYKWSWGNEESGWMGPYSSGTTISVPHTWASAGTYNVKVKAKDQSDYESSWSSGLIVTITEPSPNLSIGSISGGLLGISTEISNNGDASATNVNWNISISGGLLFSGQTQTGTLTTLNVDASEIIKDTPIIGFGTVTITVKVSADGVPEITKTADGFVFFIFVVV